jgi:hypothetical protein
VRGRLKIFFFFLSFSYFFRFLFGIAPGGGGIRTSSSLHAPIVLPDVPASEKKLALMIARIPPIQDRRVQAQHV